MFGVKKIEEILSVGIDLGTTTTSVVVSKLKIKNVAAGFLVPKIEIIEKAVIYRSEVFFTPLIDDATIDFNGIEKLVVEEYRKAKINPEEIKTGAVIITGDTARKENAESVLRAISAMAGSFVVATAGPHLEAFIAGLGSGASEYSKQNNAVVANADVGGGTTNISIFDRGKLVATLCADIGGRLIRFEPRTRKVEGFISDGIKVSKSVGINLEKGKTLSGKDLTDTAKALAASLISVLKGQPDVLAKDLAIGKYVEGIDVEYVMFSGGVGRLFYEEDLHGDESNGTRFGDLGPALALELKKAMCKESIVALKPDETIYATVIGAGVHTTELSGSTIYISDSGALPLRDLPALRLTETTDMKEVSEEIQYKMDKFSLQDERILPAIVVPESFGNRYKDIKILVQAIAAGVRTAKRRDPLVVISEDDIGKALGNLLKNSLIEPRPVISIDQLTMKEGDYIDIGKPLYDGGVVPVVIKTLVFSNS